MEKALKFAALFGEKAIIAAGTKTLLITASQYPGRSEY